MQHFAKPFFFLVFSRKLQSFISHGFFSSHEHKVLMVSNCDWSMPVVHRAASATALLLQAYSFYTPGPIDLKLGRKHWGDS